MKKSWLMFGLVVVLVLGLTFSCAAPAPAPTPAPAPAPTPAPAPQPPTEHEPVKIEVLGAGPGGRGYTLAHVMADVINKYGPEWLSATGVATRGHVENILMTYKDPERRAKTLVYTGDMVLDAAMLGTWDFTEKITGLKVIAITHVGNFYLEVLDPNITKWSDLAGKKVASDKAGSGKARYFTDIFAQAGFPVENVKITVATAKDALIAGTIDAKNGASVYAGAGEAPAHQSPTIELIAQKKEKLHFITIPKEVCDKTTKATGIRYTYSEFPVKAFAPWQTEPVGGFAMCNMWGVWPEFPDEVVEAILKTYYDNAEKFRAYHASARGLSQETIAWMNIRSLEDVDPTALKFYQEKGIKVGLPEKFGE